VPSAKALSARLQTTVPAKETIDVKRKTLRQLANVNLDLTVWNGALNPNDQGNMPVLRSAHRAGQKPCRTRQLGRWRFV
jgi:hypothetical protein